MTVGEIAPAFLAVCPSFSDEWERHLDFWEGEPERGPYNDAGVIARHLVGRFELGDYSEFPAAFELLERCLAEGNEGVREIAIIGLIEGIQNVASHRPFGHS